MIRSIFGGDEGQILRVESKFIGVLLRVLVEHIFHLILRGGYTWLLGGSAQLHRNDVTIQWDLVMACAIKCIPLNMGALIISEWIVFNQDNKKVFFLPVLITALWKSSGQPLFDANEVLPMDYPFTLFWLVTFYF